MVNLGTETKLSSEKVLARATAFFGEGGLGLETRRDSDTCLTFIGGGGYVTVTTAPIAKGTDVTVASQEWERDATRFLSRLS